MLQNTVQRVADHFFGEGFRRYMECVDSILGCNHLDRFNEVKTRISEQDLAQLFDSCLSKDTLSAKFNQRESKATFMRLKMVSQNSDFI